MIVPGLEIKFKNKYDELSLFYYIYDWPPAQKFYNLIKQSIENNDALYSDTSFNLSIEDEQQLLTDINNLILDINKEYNLSIMPIKNEVDLNTLHRDSVPADGDLWRVINDKIHSYEQFKSHQESLEPRVNAYFTFETEESIPLQKQDFLFFKVDRDYGDLCLNYTYKGKHWLELQSDNDLNAVTDGQLQPEDRIKATGYMIFRPPSPTPFFRINRFVNWFVENFPEKDITYDMALGYLLVGKLVMPADWSTHSNRKRAQWTKLLCQYKNIFDIKLINIDLENTQHLLKKSRMT